ncbi:MULTISPECIES: bifunctional UDP-N-acetylglucosamine diphosphorylase/glucosamine-1-phosphate N-acetyltransferase GlmU [unclassified Gemella]|uniref:bifunctional UDP-N-acetylglucosamine diphosphorylase/glucosamine-1-phosphate N-acetyltransferase GlmU n=1 Tax=unclassified Gemella TaxID=2624949 RepID=UPI001C03C604|nr:MULTISPECIES: bifunctional UDP-N-acetylglucosamine diphosphorylase/glucosamine-1-phosphate N-acetyltransferase GlmU [unclassified Gemella]MBU0278261.1 bifunctional UDP-N-acetylglucosamine diphosphorylase/glucosamine-1-phosphate N-acetyltransferase GlmU [Gemella sp. zg-1178]QWQ38231.1 bifunctional UDP-N-acetylglucosamine diphosphorylase/glucosamine-1-phosphate N-acetyltransferase GlmU [Gemella sp. zg-570]
MTSRYVVILAAGKGTRMQSKLYKVLHKVCDRTMVELVLDSVKNLGMKEIITVVGHGAEQVKSVVGDRSKFVLQSEQLGTAHAVKMARSELADKEGTTIVMYGDTPLIKSSTVDAMLNHHELTQAKATVLTAYAENPYSYGRIIRDVNANLVKIVEEKDATAEEKKIKEINSGIYCFDNKLLFEMLDLVKNNNNQGEYYLPDVLSLLREKNEKIETYVCDDFDETFGVNDRVALAYAENIMRGRINNEHMLKGVTLVDPSSTYIAPNVLIGKDTTIYPNVTIKSNTIIGEDCKIKPNSYLENAIIEDGVDILQSTIINSKVGKNSSIGPYAHLRNNSEVGENSRIGNFVEIKNSTYGKNSKTAHLSYIGDATIGNNTNIGCGTITVNYDGQNKYKTSIGNDTFIGCNSNLIAPLSIGNGVVVAAGTTVTKDIKDDTLAIARVKQENKEGYAKKLPSRRTVEK